MLKFLDPDDVPGQAGNAATQLKPFDILIERRPDLPHLPLTCENTNTALPYIDIVNEILEYFVAKDRLEADAAHDTGEATTLDLLAEPYNILPEAYSKLNDARYPLALPFDLWLETVRRFFEHFETPLWRVLDVFRPSNELFANADPEPYCRSAVFTEYLGISPAEAEVFTSSELHTKWHRLYGYTSEADALRDANRFGTSSAPIASYRFNETTGSILAADSSGNGNHATFHNTPPLEQAGAVAGGTAVSLNGTNQYVSFPTACFGNYPKSGSTYDYSLSFEIWFNASVGASGVILGQTAANMSPDVATGGGWVPALSLGKTDGRLRASLFWHNTVILTSPEATKYDDGQWHHVAVTKSLGTKLILC